MIERIAAPPYRGRFAPSPSGPLHFGSLVAAMGSFLDAQAHGGEWLVRMEDVDPPREQPGAAADILRTLDGFGFEWSGPVLHQSRRAEAYRDAVALLLHEGLAYPCTCTRRAIAEAAVQGVEGPVYPGTCRRLPRHHSHATDAAVRCLTRPGPIAFTDRIRGALRQSVEAEVGDFVIRRRDGFFAYQLAVILDDAFQGVTHVVRGSDLHLSTPRQIHLQRLLGLPTPEYAHLPLALGPDGRKLSKQDGAHPVDRRDPLPALIAAFRFLGQGLPRDLPGTVAEFWAMAGALWRLERVPGRPDVAAEGRSDPV